MLIPEYAALSETIVKVWAWGNHTISTAIAAAHRNTGTAQSPLCGQAGARAL